ncbi:TRAP transporter small permease [bacterium]|nr:TRAP transporter small permease [bacterium]
METAFKYYQKGTEYLLKIVLALAMILLALDILSIFSEVISRYIFKSSMAEMEELPRLLIPFMVFPMMGVLLKLKSHVSVDVLPDMLKGKNRSILMIGVYAIVLAISVLFFIAGIISVKYFYDLGFETVTEVVFKFWVIYLAFPLGFGIMILIAIEMLWQELIVLSMAIKEEKQ